MDKNSKKDSSIRTIRSVARILRGIMDQSEGERLIIDQTQKERYALISSYDRIKFSELKFGPKSFYLPSPSGDSSFFPLIVSFPVRLPNDYIEPFEIWIMRITSSGLMECWKNRLTIATRQSLIMNRNIKHFNSQMDKNINTNTNKDFNLNHFERLVQLFLLCIIASFIIFMNEIFVYRLKILIKSLWYW